MTTYARPLSSLTLRKNSLSAFRPPAEAPMPTTTTSGFFGSLERSAVDLSAFVACPSVEADLRVPPAPSPPFLEGPGDRDFFFATRDSPLRRCCRDFRA